MKKYLPWLFLAALIAFPLLTKAQPATNVYMLIDGVCYGMTAGHEDDSWVCVPLDPFDPNGPRNTLSEARMTCESYSPHVLSGWTEPGSVQWTLMPMPGECVEGPPPSNRTDITITWTVPDDSQVSRTKAWWADTSGGKLDYIFSDTSRATPNQTYTQTEDPPDGPCVFIEYYAGTTLIPALTTGLQCWAENNRDLIFGASGSTGQATLIWTAPIENEDGTALTDLAGYTIHYGNSVGDYPFTNSVPDPDALSTVVTGLSTGDWVFVVTAFDFSGNDSVYSNTTSKTIQ